MKAQSRVAESPGLYQKSAFTNRNYIIYINLFAKIMATLKIAVYKGDSYDSPAARHTALVLTCDNTTQYKLHVTGGHSFFTFEELSLSSDQHITLATPDKDLAADLIPVASNISEADVKRIRFVVSTTRVDNKDRSWNCQNFVGDALRRVKNEGIITREEFDGSLDRMADVILEAPDEAI